MVPNAVLMVCRQIEIIFEMIRPGTRETIPNARLKAIGTQLSNIASTLEEAGAPDSIYTVYTSVSMFIDNITSIAEYHESDAEAKDRIVELLSGIRVDTLLFIKDYYKEHDFEYSEGNDKILRDLVILGIDNGDYFGYDKYGNKIND